MEIKPVQFNINTKSNEHKHYLEAEGPVDTTGLVKPLPGKGHLIHDNVISAPVYFVKDIGYDMKSLKNGIKGTANDHQLGRLNDVGLQLGGVGIATYLASQTTNPKARIMEYVGLAAFLTAMNVYPKIAINAPSKFAHGYDIGKWYIDDQGRKKSVNQDSNYRPMDLYRGDVKGESLDEIGDKMGISRKIKNRHDIIKEQTRKNATQSQTLWMLTAGFATPVLAALGCYGLENYVIEPQLEKSRNNKYNKLISETLNKTKQMELDISKIADNDLSTKIAKILGNYQNQQLPKEEFERITNILTEGMGENAAEGLRTDIGNIIKDSLVINVEITEEMVNAGKNQISSRKKAIIEDILIPSKEEIQNIIKNVDPKVDFNKDSATNSENLDAIKKALRNLLDTKIEKAPSNIPKEYLDDLADDIADKMTAVMENKKTKVITEDSIKKFTTLAKILGEFKENRRVLDKCSSFKFEYAPETVLARSYNKFEKALIKELGISMKDMKKMRESEEYTVKLLNEKISEICKDEKRLAKVYKHLGEIISEMEVNLHGASEKSSDILNLFNAVENNYNNTAKRLASFGGFETTITRLVNQDVASLGNNINSRQELFDYLDGIIENKYKNFTLYKIEDFDSPETKDWKARENLRLSNEYAKYNADGSASSKYFDMSRMLERYQGVKNSFNRVIHTFEVFRRTIDTETFLKTLDGLEGNHKPLSREDFAYLNGIIKIGREALLTATPADHNMKLDTVNNHLLYIDVMKSIWAPAREGKDMYKSTKAKGYVTNLLNDKWKDELNKIASGNLLDRFQTYITRFRNIAANSQIDFTKPNHLIDKSLPDSYTPYETTRMSFFNLIGQTPVDMIQGASKRQYGTKKWFRIVSGIAASVFAVTILAQTKFGKLSNPHNVKKQVKNETSK